MNKNLEIAVMASLKAGKVIMEVYNSVFDVAYKDDNSPLTAADKRANEIINALLKRTPYPIISEENKQTDYAIRKTWDTCWIVDPVDGTKEFVKRNGEFTVNIALVSNGIPQLGVIYVPVTQTLYYADVSKKQAYKVILDSHEATLETVVKNAQVLEPKVITSEIVKVVGSRSHQNTETLDFIENLKNSGNSIELVSKGSSLKFCLLAEGLADIYPRFAPTMEWDTAAGHAICKAVGVDVISNETNKELQYNKENLLNPWFVASSNER